MAGFFGRRNAWANGPPPGGGEGGGGGGPVQGNRNVLGVGSGSAKDAEEDAKRMIFQRKKKEENRSLFHETLKRESVKEKNYMIFNIRAGEELCSYEQLGSILIDLGIKPEEVTSINGNPYNQREIEVLLVENVEVDVANWSKKLDEKGLPLTVNKIGMLEEVFIIRNLPLTLNIEQMKSWISEAVKPFVSEVNGVIPLKYSVNRIKALPEQNRKYFEGKYDGSWRVSVSPKGAAEVPSFIAVGPEDMQGTIRYIKRGPPVEELCWSCYGTGHKKFDKTGGSLVCPGPKDWTEYVNEFKTHASNISGKRAEELFGFHESSAQVVQYERQLTIAAKELEETEFKLREAREKAAEEIGNAKEEWKSKNDRLQEEMGVLKSALKDKTAEEIQIKEEMEALKKEIETLREKSTEDVIALANLGSENENLARLVAKGSTLDDDDGLHTLQVKSPLLDDPHLLDTDLAMDETQSKKHSLSPDSEEKGVSKVARSNSVSDKMDQEVEKGASKLARSNSLSDKMDQQEKPTPSSHLKENETKDSEDLNISAPDTLFNQPVPPPHPSTESIPVLPLIKPKKTLIQGNIIEIKTGKGKVQAKVLNCLDKKNHFKVKIVKSEDKRYKVDDEATFDLKTNLWNHIPQQNENVKPGILKNK